MMTPDLSQPLPRGPLIAAILLWALARITLADAYPIRVRTTEGVSLGSCVPVTSNQRNVQWLTAAHVVGNHRTAEVRVGGVWHPARVDAVHTARSADLALVISAPVEGVRARPIAKAPPAIGEAINWGGFPRGGSLRWSSGTVTESSSGGTLIWWTGQAIQGESGGPILNRRGELVGVTFGVMPVPECRGQVCRMPRRISVGNGLGAIAAFRRELAAAAETQPKPPARSEPNPPAESPAPACDCDRLRRDLAAAIAERDRARERAAADAALLDRVRSARIPLRVEQSVSDDHWRVTIRIDPEASAYTAVVTDGSGQAIAPAPPKSFDRETGLRFEIDLPDR